MVFNDRTAARDDDSVAARFGAALLRASHAAVQRASSLNLMDIAIGLSFSGFLLFQIVHHAMWSDELNAWGVVLDSPSPYSLFAHLHYEGHPGLWHLLLWFASWVSREPQTMQGVHAAIALGVIWMIAVASPFTRAERILVLLSYFVLFEYTVISRNYGIGLLLALIYAERRARHPDQRKRNALLLGLLANTNVLALILSAALALEYALGLWKDRRVAQWLGELFAPAAILLGMTILSIATFKPAADISWRTTGQPSGKVWSLDEVATVVANNLAALMPVDVQAYWYSKVGPQALAYTQLRLAIICAAPVLVVLLIRLFAPLPRLLIVLAATFAGSIAFNLIFYEGSIRHWGINFVAFLSALWILRVSRPQTWHAWPLLSINAAAGIIFTWQHWMLPFSNAGATADWIRAAGFENAALVGTPDHHVAAVAELLDRPIRFLECECSSTYLAYNNRRDDFDKSQIPDRLTRAADAMGTRPILYLNTAPVTAEQIRALAERHIELRPRAAFTDAINCNFYVYEVVRNRLESPRP